MTEKKVKYTNFKERYEGDEKFREKHKKYMTQKITCTCGKKIRRNYMTRHKKTKNHELALLKKDFKAIKDLLTLKKN